MRMKHALVATSLIALWYGLGAMGAPAESGLGDSAPSGSETPAGSPQTDLQTPPAIEPTPAPDSPGIGSDLDKVNYSLGYELGQDLKRDGLAPVPEALMKGVQDAISGAQPQVKTSQRRAALADIKAKRAEEHLQRSLAFLADNAKKEGVTTLDSGLQYKELRAGEGKSPSLDDRVTVQYRGTLIDGSEFDSTYTRGKPANLDVKRVIRGWREGLQLMKEGAKWELYIPPELGYGKSGRDQRIPPNSALIFELELLAVEQAPPASPEARGPQAPRDLSDE